MLKIIKTHFARFVISYNPNKNSFFTISIVLITLLILLAFHSITLGRYPISFFTTWYILFDNILPFIENAWLPVEESIVELIRLPRILSAICIGAGLSIAGAAVQGLFRNPLVDSGIIGVTSGAAFGGTLGILLIDNYMITVAVAFFFGILSVVLVRFLASVNGRTSILTLVLSGVIVSTFFSAVISIIKLLADPYSKLPSIVYWLMGSIASVGYIDLLIIFLTVAPFSFILYTLKYHLNVLSLGEKRSVTLGVKFEQLKWVIFICIAFISAGIVAVCGMIGWVGLVIPHCARFLVGADHMRLMPTAALLGAIFLLIVDNFARTATAVEIPIGIATAIIGIPIFAGILRYKANKSGGWSDD